MVTTNIATLTNFALTTTDEPTESVQIRYGTARVRQVRVHRAEPKAGKRTVFSELELDGRVVNPTRRFWRSFFSRFGIAENVFRYFNAEEVFSRISDLNMDSSFRDCIAEKEQKADLLAITGLNWPVVRHTEICDLVQRYGSKHVSDHDGIVNRTPIPRGGARKFAIGGD